MRADQPPDDHELTVLGRTVRHAIDHVEVFPAPAHVTTVRMTSDELTSICPVTQRPRGGIEVRATADRVRP